MTPDNKKKPWYHYRLYGVPVRSEIPFPELALVQVKPAKEKRRITFRQGNFGFTPNGNSQKINGLHYARSSDGKTAWVYSRLAGQFRVRLKHREITWKPLRQTSPGFAQLVLKGKVLGFLLSQWPDFFLLHGSTVDVGGEAVTFCASFRQGKSTLTSHFLSRGNRLVSDDLTAIRYERGMFWVYPGAPEVRLWPASSALLEQVPNERLYPEAKKNRFYFDQRNRRLFSAKPVPLRTLFILSRRRRGNIQVEPLKGQEAFSEVLKQAYLPLIHDPLLPNHFEQVTRLIENIPVKRLIYPSGFAHLGKLRKAVLSEIAED